MIRGVLKIRNDSGAPYPIAEIGGHVLADGAELDLCDPAVPNYYEGPGGWSAADLLVRKCEAAQLRIDIVAGNITVTESTRPRDGNPLPTS